MTQRTKHSRLVIQWLLDSDPSIRWQVMRDLTDAPAHAVAAERVAEAIDLVASKRDENGRWLLETRYPGVMPVEVDEVEIDEGEGRPSRWITLRALRVLDWYSARG